MTIPMMSIYAMAVALMLFHPPAWVAEAFVVAPPLLIGRTSSSSKRGSRRLASTAVPSTDDELDELRKEIEELRKEAMIRIEEVSVKADAVLSEGGIEIKRESLSSVSVETLARTPYDAVKDNGISAVDDNNKKAIPLPTKPSSQRKKIDLSETVHASDAALANTYWKVALDIGREPGTWMPDTWGTSGKRLMLQLEIQFRPDWVKGDREDFLGDRGGKLVHVIQNDGVFGPSMSESAKHVRFSDGAWTISRGEGPAGTDLLRFYVELEEKVERDDVYCPAGRIYLTCGYFDVAHRGHSRKRDLEKKLEDLANEHNDILDALNAEGMFSLNRVKAWNSLQKKKADIEKTKEQLQRIQIMEPDLNLLRLSRKRDVGITKEGGACCKVKRSAGYFEYHILGKFHAVSVEHGDLVE